MLNQVFGPSKSIETGPYDDIHRVVEKELKCRTDCDEGLCLKTFAKPRFLPNCGACLCVHARRQGRLYRFTL